MVSRDEVSAGELERLSRSYVDAIFPILGEKSDVPAPDMNTNGQIMAWMIDEYIKLSGDNSFGTFTGKPVELNGSLGRNRATGLGVAIVIASALKTQNKNIQGATVAVQGFGNVGSFTAKCAYDMGAKICACFFVPALDFSIYLMHNTPANPKDCHLNHSCMRLHKAHHPMSFILDAGFFVG